MSPSDISPRWVGTGRTVFNNKGKPVRQYEPFFTDTHRFEFGVKDRRQPGALLRSGRARRRHAAPEPHLGEGRLRSVAAGDLRRERHGARMQTGSNRPRRQRLRERVTSHDLAAADTCPTWYAQRIGNAGARCPSGRRAQRPQRTPTRPRRPFRHAGPPFLTLAHNRFERDAGQRHRRHRRAVRDAGRARHRGQPAGGRSTPRTAVVMRYDYDMLGNRIHQASMEAGERWTLSDVAGKPIRAWDSRASSAA